jgi:hypothetical protein
VCFLVSGALAYAVVAGRLLALPPRTVDGAEAALNLFGCIAFGISALGAYVVPGTETAVDAAVANAGTAIGAAAFLVAAALSLHSLQGDLTPAG